MTIDAILEKLRLLSDSFPADAVRAAVAQREAITPRLIEVLEAVIGDPDSVAEQDEYILHIHALYLLAQFREKQAFPVVIRFARIPDPALDALLADDTLITLSRVLASTYGGDPGLLHKLIEDPKVSEMARSAGIRALAILGRLGVVPVADVQAYFKLLYLGVLEREPSYVWEELGLAIVAIGAKALYPEARRAYEEGLVIDSDEQDGELDDEEDEGEQASGTDPEAGGEESDAAGEEDFAGFVLVDSAETELSEWACFTPGFEPEVDFDEDDGPGVEPADALPPGEPLPPGAAIYKPASQAPAAGRNDPCPCGSGKKFKKCCGV